MTQKVKEIALKDLVLWSENPRDPISPAGKTNQQIAEHAINGDKRSKWSIKKLINQFRTHSGGYYHFNELPTVVPRDDGRYTVYDGNQRVIVGMLIHGIVHVGERVNLDGFVFPVKIPCNVCDKKTAIGVVDRMHGKKGGTWNPLERDMFRHKYMDQGKTPFQIFDESTGYVSEHSHLNQDYVKEEILNERALGELGMTVNEGVLKHSYEKDGTVREILDAISTLVNDKEITTRKNRGKIVKLLQGDPRWDGWQQGRTEKTKVWAGGKAKKKPTRRTPASRADMLFGDTLQLKSGSVNNLYCDIIRMYSIIESQEKKFSHPWIFIRMALRLLCEHAFGDGWGAEIKTRFDAAKSRLTKDEKTILRTQAVSSGDNMVMLLNVGAHGYTAARNKEQTIALSLVLGKMLEEKYGIKK